MTKRAKASSKDPKHIFYRYLRDKAIRHSKQRDLILDVFLKTERHLAIPDLYSLVKRRYSNIGYATVYRTMKLICAAGLAEEVDFGDGITRFEHKYGHEHHDHVICIRCGKFVEAMNPAIERMQERLAQDHGFTYIRHRMQIFGICKGCKGKKREEAG
ncbi:MAG: transcriptional repressor [Desulfatiglandales bacterium]